MNFILSLICWALLLIGFVFIAGYFVAHAMRERNKAEYLMLITYLERYIDRAEVTDDAFRYIREQFDEVYRNNQDHARTLRLFAVFCMKYKDYWIKLLE